MRLYIPGSITRRGLNMPQCRVFTSQHNAGSTSVLRRLIVLLEEAGVECASNAASTPVETATAPPKKVARGSICGFSTGEQPRNCPIEVASALSKASHALVLLNQQSFVGEVGSQFAQEVRQARAAGVPLLLLHDVDSCPFDRFFQTTPEDLIHAGIYKKVWPIWGQ